MGWGADGHRWPQPRGAVYVVIVLCQGALDPANGATAAAGVIAQGLSRPAMPHRARVRRDFDDSPRPVQRGADHGDLPYRGGWWLQGCSKDIRRRKKVGLACDSSGLNGPSKVWAMKYDFKLANNWRARSNASFSRRSR